VQVWDKNSHENLSENLKQKNIYGNLGIELRIILILCFTEKYCEEWIVSGQVRVEMLDNLSK
jgi:hypothetical protein